MFYRIIASALVLMGLWYIIVHLSWPLDITPDSLENSAIGLSTIFIGLLNLAYVYETSDSLPPKIIVLSANLLFIGFSILMITSSLVVGYGYVTLILSLINCVMVLNHKV